MAADLRRQETCHVIAIVNEPGVRLPPVVQIVEPFMVSVDVFHLCETQVNNKSWVKPFTESNRDG